MHEGVCHTFPKCSLGIVRHTNAQEPHHELFLAVSRPKTCHDFLHDTEQGPAEEIIYQDLCIGQDLESYLVGWEQALKCFFFPKEEQSKHTDRPGTVICLNGS